MMCHQIRRSNGKHKKIVPGKKGEVVEPKHPAINPTSPPKSDPLIAAARLLSAVYAFDDGHIGYCNSRI
jgi:hypothetical protein